LLSFCPFALLGGEALCGFVLAAREGVAGAKRPIGVCGATDSIGTGSAEGLDEVGASKLPVTAVYTAPISTPRRTATRRVVIHFLQLIAPPPIRVVRGLPTRIRRPVTIDCADGHPSPAGDPAQRRVLAAQHAAVR
jgi:hypothetical protein